MFSGKRYFCFFLLPALFLSACASRPAPVAVKPRAGGRFRRPPVISPIEQTLELVKQNGNNLEKYFLLNEDDQIAVRARVSGDAGDYEVFYDLEGAEALPGASYKVHFTIREANSGTSREDTLIWAPRTTSSGLLLSFDDDYTDSWESCFDLFESYGAKVTFFIQGKPAPFGAAAISRGHDVGYHSLNHLDLRKTSETAFIRQTLEPAESFSQAGIPLSSFAYPFGFSEPWMHEILLQSFGVLRGYGVTYRLYKKDEINSAYIISRAIDRAVIPEDGDFERDITLMLRTVKFLEGALILPLTTHEISDTAVWGISKRRLEYLLKTAADLSLVFYRYRDFAE